MSDTDWELASTSIRQVRAAIIRRYRLSKETRHTLKERLCRQVVACKSEEARRLILGVSEQEPEEICGPPIE